METMVETPVACFFIHIYDRNGRHRLTVGEPFPEEAAKAFLKGYNRPGMNSKAIMSRQVVNATAPAEHN